MTELKPESVGRPPGVATMTPTADTELHGNKNIINNSLSHPGANWTRLDKAGDAAPTPTTWAKKKRESQARLLSTNTKKKRDERLSPRRGMHHWVVE